VQVHVCTCALVNVCACARVHEYQRPRGGGAAAAADDFAFVSVAQGTSLSCEANDRQGELALSLGRDLQRDSEGRDERGAHFFRARILSSWPCRPEK
jgi:hypothetical protein